jgi:hypothetical protein
MFFSRKTDADRWYMEKRREKELVKSGLRPHLIFKQLGEFAKDWLLSRKVQHPITTWKNEEERLSKFVLPEYSTRNLHEIQTGEWESFLEGLVTKLGRTPSTCNRYRTMLHKIYEDALRKDFVAYNPVSRVPEWRENKAAFAYFETEDECRAYLNHARREYYFFFLFATIALNTGAHHPQNPYPYLQRCWFKVNPRP